ncbi:MAG: preprotein translocase subunit YajC [Clostridiales bacterium]|nr:preprotein translocase subunit YajC [Clostridiales bacterium]MBO4580295.1 preprotein translocase subunit YajC [Clostridiales bacterium]
MFDLIKFDGTAAGGGDMLTGGDMMGTLYSIGLLVLMFVVFYFLLIRPQRKRDKEMKQQMEKLAVGDKVVTIGGLVGLVANIKEDEITISTSAANTLVTFTKSSIQTVVKRDDIGKTPEEPEKTGFFGRKKTNKEKEE